MPRSSRGFVNEPMMIGESFPDSPKDIIYAQIRAVLFTRGHLQAEAISGLLALMEPWKDEKWYEDMKDIDEKSDHPWTHVEAVIRLLSRKNMWASTPRTVKEGEEFAQAI